MSRAEPTHIRKLKVYWWRRRKEEHAKWKWTAKVRWAYQNSEWYVMPYAWAWVREGETETLAFNCAEDEIPIEKIRMIQPIEGWDGWEERAKAETERLSRKVDQQVFGS